LKYLAPYVFRVALRNNRILAMQDGQVTFRYQDGESRQTRTCTLPAEAFIGRFLPHILPKGFVNVRYYGLFRVGARQHLTRLRAQRVLLQRKVALGAPLEETAEPATRLGPVCPSCGREMRLERVLPPQRAPPAPQPLA